VGYCQGLNFVAGLLLMYLPERHAFGGLVVLMHDRGLRNYYSIDMSLLQVSSGNDWLHTALLFRSSETAQLSLC
jgi:hypothetical protein